MEANSEKVERAIAEVAIQEKEEGEYILENKKEGLGEQCHLVKEEFVKLRGESSDLLLKNISGISFPLS